MPNNYITKKEAEIYEVFLFPTPEQFDLLVKKIVPKPRKWTDSEKLDVFANVNFNNKYTDNYGVICPICKEPYLIYALKPSSISRQIWCYSCQSGIG